MELLMGKIEDFGSFKVRTKVKFEIEESGDGSVYVKSRIKDYTGNKIITTGWGFLKSVKSVDVSIIKEELLAKGFEVYEKPVAAAVDLGELDLETDFNEEAEEI